jgi:hypothetical protein
MQAIQSTVDQLNNLASLKTLNSRTWTLHTYYELWQAFLQDVQAIGYKVEPTANYYSCYTGGRPRLVHPVACLEDGSQLADLTFVQELYQRDNNDDQLKVEFNGYFE